MTTAGPVTRQAYSSQSLKTATISWSPSARGPPPVARPPGATNYLRLDAPHVLAGMAAPAGAIIAVQDQAVLGSQLIQDLRNVYFKWLESNGQREKADRLEALFNYIYPLAYLVAFGIAALKFLK